MLNKNIFIGSQEKYLDKALEIALKYKITVYDSLYIALANEKNMPLLTLDEEQVNVAKKIGIEVIHV